MAGGDCRGQVRLARWQFFVYGELGLLRHLRGREFNQPPFFCASVRAWQVVALLYSNPSAGRDAIATWHPARQPIAEIKMHRVQNGVELLN